MVRHEMLHAVLQRRVHPRSQFLRVWADRVICRDVYLKQAGAWRVVVIGGTGRHTTLLQCRDYTAYCRSIPDHWPSYLAAGAGKVSDDAVAT